MTRIDLTRPLAPVTVEVSYEPTERSQLNVQVEEKFHPISMEVELSKPQHHLTELEMQLERPPTGFPSITVDFPHPDKSGQPAIFVRKFPESVTLKENVPARIAAQMFGVPEPSVSWLKDGHPLKPSDGTLTTIEVLCISYPKSH